LSGRDSSTDSGAARINTPPAPLSMPLTTAALPSFKPATSALSHALIQEKALGFYEVILFQLKLFKYCFGFSVTDKVYFYPLYVF